VKISIKFAVAVTLAFGMSGHSHAQQGPKAKNAPPAAQATPATAAGDGTPASTPAPAGWIARCSSASRGAPLECAIEQTAVLTKTGQLIVLINVRVSAETRTPLALVQLPLGLNLPAGAKLQVDDGKTSDLQIQTCEARGCYANVPISADVLAAMKSGKQLKVSFQNLANEIIAIPMPLADFAAAYEKIK
jgi:invasion protein IalB